MKPAYYQIKYVVQDKYELGGVTIPPKLEAAYPPFNTVRCGCIIFDSINQLIVKSTRKIYEFD